MQGINWYNTIGCFAVAVLLYGYVISAFVKGSFWKTGNKDFYENGRRVTRSDEPSAFWGQVIIWIAVATGFLTLSILSAFGYIDL